MEHRIIDFHTHAFPDALAARAMKALLAEAPGIKAYLDGTVADLLRSMDKAGIEKSVVCCIATKPEQFEPILRWCTAIRSERLIPFPSVHPADPACVDGVRRIRAEGFPGIKLHPFYQDFFADEDRMFDLYEETIRQGLLLVMHTGYDIAFPQNPAGRSAEAAGDRRDVPRAQARDDAPGSLAAVGRGAPASSRPQDLHGNVLRPGGAWPRAGPRDDPGPSGGLSALRHGFPVDRPERERFRCSKICEFRKKSSRRFWPTTP